MRMADIVRNRLVVEIWTWKTLETCSSLCQRRRVFIGLVTARGLCIALFRGFRAAAEMHTAQHQNLLIARRRRTLTRPLTCTSDSTIKTKQHQLIWVLLVRHSLIFIFTASRVHMDGARRGFRDPELTATARGVHKNNAHPSFLWGGKRIPLTTVVTDWNILPKNWTPRSKILVLYCWVTSPGEYR